MATMTTTTALSLQKPLSRLKNGGLAVGQRLKKTDPSHLNCFGDECFRLSTSFGKIVGWRIIGDLRATALDLQNTFLHLINDKRPYWQSSRPKSDPSPFHEPTYSLDSFLIGPDQAHASPHVTIVTSDEWVANRLKSIIIESKILKSSARWGCFKLPAQITLTSPAARHMTLSPGDNPLGDNGVYEVCISGEIIPSHLDGVSIEIWKDGLYIGNATVGGFLTVGDQVLALSAAHVFYPRQTPATETFEIDESELEFLLSDSLSCGDDDVDLDEPPCQPHSPGQWLPSSSRTTLSLDSEASAPQTPLSTIGPKTTIGYLERISSIRGMDDRNRIGLDWALITITHPSIVMGNKLRHWHGRRNAELTENRIEILTGSAAITAELVSNAIFGLPMDALPQPVLVANDASTTQGDSGSWAFRLTDRRAVGMLIGNCQPLTQCYLLGMEHILSDIQAQTGLPTKVAPAKVFSPLEQPNFLRFVDEQRCSGIDGSGNEAYYISAPKLREYWSRERVSSLLNDFGQGEGLTFDVFFKRYLRLFSVLMYINEPEQFCWFMNQEVDDSCLPYKRDNSSNYEMESLFDLFEENQWMFCPLEFNASLRDSMKVHPRTVLPVTSQGILSNLGRGGVDGVFSRVHINKDCNISMPNSTVMFKVYDLSDTQFPAGHAARAASASNSQYTHRNTRQHQWSSEIKAFEALRRRGGSEHIIQYYGSFSQGKKGIIILEDASGVPLMDFLRREKPPTDPVNSLLFWENMFELMKGLERIHNLPEAQQIPSWRVDWTSTRGHQFCKNTPTPMIMVLPAVPGVRSQPIFKLADFNLSLCHCDCDKSQPYLSKDILALGAQLNTSAWSNYELRSRADVWAFGSTLLECLVWMLAGDITTGPVHTAYKSFRSMMPGYQDQDNAKITALYNALRTHRNSTRVTEAVSSFVFHRMLRNRNQTSESARQLYRGFQDEVLPFAHNDEPEAWESRSAALEHTAADLSSQHVTWETRSQRSTTSWDKASKLAHSDADSGFFSGTSVAGADSRKTHSDADSGFFSAASVSGAGSGQTRSTRSDVDSGFFSGSSLPSATSLQSSLLKHLTEDSGEPSLAEPSEPMFTVEDINEFMASMTKPDAASTSSSFMRQQLAKASKPRLDRRRAAELIHTLRGRDQIFVIDDSASMKPHWRDVTATYSALEHVWKVIEPDGNGTDLYFTSDPIIGYHSKNNERLASILNTTPVCGISTMRNSLEALTDRIITQNIGVAGEAHSSTTASGRPISVYILTDGNWHSPLESRETAVSGVEHVINRLTQEVERRKKPSDFISVQFISFANSEAGVKRLKVLDDTLGRSAHSSKENHDSNNICDVTSHRGSVWKMLLGSLRTDKSRGNQVDK